MDEFCLLNDNIIYHDNCMNIISLIPENYIDAIITDFPYGIDYQSNRSKIKKEKIANDKKPYLEWINPSFNLLKDGGRLICFYRYDVQEELFFELTNSGFNIKSQLVWNKIGTSMGDLNAEFAPQHELMVYATKGRYEFKNGRPSTVYNVQKLVGNQIIHPNEKPIDLMRKIIIDITEKNERIFDPFSGSGSVSVAAKIEKRRFISCDLDKNYVDIGNERLITKTKSMW